MSELETYLTEQKSRMGESEIEKYLKEKNGGTVIPVAEVIKKQMKEIEARIVWRECVMCEYEYGDLPEDGICGNCRLPKVKPNEKKTTEDDINEIIDFKCAASGEAQDNERD